jgi:hypothetical protein
MDLQITVRELIAQLQECPPDALVDISIEVDEQYISDVMVACDENLAVLVSGRNPDVAWVSLRGFR